jgi:ABC-type lipoprotein export system ATPase subunit
MVASRHPDGLLLRADAELSLRARDLDADDDAVDVPALEPLPVEVLPVELSQVSAGFGSHVLFQNLDLRVRPGDWVSVRGPSGSGKSTLMSLVSGLVDPLGGVIRVAGQAWTDRARSERAALRRRWLAAMPQQPSLLERMSVAENLTMTAAVRGGPSSPELASATLERLGLAELADQPASQLSGGERQRLSLARLLVSSAPTLVLDEPTSQQDEASARRVVEALQRETAAGRCLLVASHDERCFAAATVTVELGGHRAA